jgi:hypothetical protein
MKSVTNHFRRLDLFLLIFSIIVVLLYVSGAGGGFALDDSWIHQTYARNLAYTGQWAFVPGVPSAASTSPMFTVLLAIGYKLGVDFKLWTFGLGALALALTGMLGARLAERLAPTVRQIGMVVGLTLVFTWHLIWAAASGMETMLFCMMTLALMVLAWGEVDARNDTPLIRGAIFGALAALATLARPEGAVLAGLIGIVMLIARPQDSWRTFVVWMVGAVIGFAVFIAPYLVLNLQLTGGFLPDTAAAKQAEHAPLLGNTYPERLINMAYPLIGGGQLLLVPGIGFFIMVVAQRFRQSHETLFHLLPLLWATTLVGLYATRLPAPYQHGRYVIPALPSLIVVGVIGMLWLVQRGQKSLGGRVLSRSLLISAALAFLYFAFGAGLMAYRQDVRVIDEEMVASAHWIADNLSPNDLLAVHDIGAVGYFAPRPILDLAGLVSPEVVPIILDKEPLWDLMRQRGVRYLMAFPNQVPGQDVSDPRLCPIFTTNGQTVLSMNEANMTIYALTWDGVCRE